MGNHFQYCDKMGVCGLCKATDVTFKDTYHSYYTDHNETEHWSVCSKCGEITNKAEHWQSSDTPGECYVCHAKMCAHTNKTPTGEVSQISVITGYDETYHWGSIKRWEGYTCNDCNKSLTVTTEVEKEEHRLDEKGCCKDCSYEKPKPTAAPTAVPTEAPTAVPTTAPTAVPTAAPTEAPTAIPTEAPVAKVEEHYFSDRALQVVGIDWNDTTILPVDLSKDGVTQIPVRDNRFIVGYVLVEVKGNDVTVTAEMSKQVTKIKNGSFCWIPDLEANLEDMTMLDFGTAQTKPGDIGLLYVTGAVWHHQSYASISECSTAYWPNHPKWVAWRADHQKLIGE